jgi:autotransporter-associated beta strand protein
MKFKACFHPILACAIVGLAARSQAAPVTWAAPVTIAGDADVATAGTPVFAYNWAGSAQTINGVAFTAAGTGATMGGFGGVHTTAFGSTSPPYVNLSPAYKAVLVGSIYTGASACTVTLNSLTPGRQYQIQLWVNDSRALNLGYARTETVTTGGGNTVTLSYPGNVDGAPGQYTIGTFTADASSQVITLLGNSATQVNALQLRDLSPLPNVGYWNGLGGASWDSATTANWCLNQASAPLVNGTFAAAMLANANQARFGDTYFDNGTAVAVTQSNVTIAVGGVATGGVGFVGNTVNYTLASADDTGLTGATELTKSGTASLTLTGLNTHTGGTTLSGGTLNLGHPAALGSGPLTLLGGTLVNSSGGPLVTTGNNPQNWNGNFTFSGPADLNLGTGSVTLSDHRTVTTTAGNLTLGGSVSGIGRNLTKLGAGTLAFTGAATLNNLDIQNGGVVVDGGSYTCPNGTGGWGLWVRGTTNSFLTVKNNATVTVTTGFQIQQGTATLESGSITVAGNGVAEIYLGNSTNPATLTIKGGTVTGRTMSFGNGGSPATLNLEGGSLVWNTAPSKGSGTATLNLGGGTLRAGGSFTVPTSLPFTLTGTNGPLTVDTQAFNTTLANALNGTGGLTKAGAGTLTLTSASCGFTGPTTVNAGTLAVSGSLTGGTAVTAEGGTFAVAAAGLVDLAPITVKDGGTLRVDATGNILKSVTVENGGSLSLAAVVGETTTVNEALTFVGGPTVTVKPLFGGTPTAGSYTLLTPGSVAGAPAAILTDLGIYNDTRAYQGNAAMTNGKLVLTVTGDGTIANLVWNNASGTGNWSLKSAADQNFTTGGGNEMFYNQDAVTFNGIAPGKVTLVGTLIPAAITVDSAAGADYAFEGTGEITGEAVLTKLGDSVLTLNTANSFTGGVYLDGGTLVVGQAGALGTSGRLSFGGGTLQYSATNTVDYSPRLATSGQQFNIDTRGQTVTWATALAAGSGTLTKLGEGTLRLTAAPNHGGITTVRTGTLELFGNIVTYGGGEIAIHSGASLRVSGSRYDFNGRTFTFDSAGGGTLEDASDDGAGGFVQLTAGNTFVTTGGAQNQFTGTATNSYNLNNNIATFDIAPGTDAVCDLKVSCRMGNAGGVTKIGTGRLELAAANLYTGVTTVTAGTLLVSGSLTSATPILVDTDATLSLAATGTLNFKPTINGIVRSITGTGTAAFDGAFTLDLTTTDATAGNTWQLVEAANLAESYTANFKVTGFGETPADSGIWTKSDGTKVWKFTEATGTLTVETGGYASWAASFSLTGESALATADPDHDGVANGIEFMTGSSPIDSTSRNAPSIVRNGNGDLVITFSRVDLAEAYQVAVEYGTDLRNWTPMFIPNDAITGPPVTVIDNAADPDSITVLIPAAGAPKKFARVQIAIP